MSVVVRRDEQRRQRPRLEAADDGLHRQIAQRIVGGASNAAAIGTSSIATGLRLVSNSSAVISVTTTSGRTRGDGT
jgi:hypothetical protein